jgi:flagellar biosynthesis protein FliQ
MGQEIITEAQVNAYWAMLYVAIPVAIVSLIMLLKGR